MPYILLNTLPIFDDLCLVSLNCSESLFACAYVLSTLLNINFNIIFPFRFITSGPSEIFMAYASAKEWYLLCTILAQRAREVIWLSPFSFQFVLSCLGSG